MCKSTVTQGEWHRIRDGCVTHQQPQSDGKVFWSLNKKNLQQSIFISWQKRLGFFFFPLFLLWSNGRYKEPIAARWYSRLRHSNYFDYEQYGSRCFSHEMVPQREKSSTWELVCQNEVHSSRPPLPVIFPQEGREAELVEHSHEHVRKFGQRSIVTPFGVSAYAEQS